MNLAIAVFLCLSVIGAVLAGAYWLSRQQETPIPPARSIPPPPTPKSTKPSAKPKPLRDRKVVTRRRDPMQDVPHK